MAAFALGMLAHKDANSAEAAVRAVLRIASLRNHERWRVWAELQLTELVDEDSARDSVRHILDDAFPDPHRQSRIFDAALRDYLATRKASSEENGRRYLADIGDIEHDLPIYQASLLRDINVDALAQRDLRHRILNRVKNQAQRYLMKVEKDEPLSSSVEDD
ncbi:MAG TPA: hypothetical protein VGD01_17685 [Candidatus Elarobacter sp.]